MRRAPPSRASLTAPRWSPRGASPPTRAPAAGAPGVGAGSGVDLCADVGDRARVAAALERGETLHDVEIQGRRRDGVLIWVTVNVRPAKDVGGRTPHYEWSLADITERRQLESQLRQAQKMEAVGQLAGGVAHDFNNLLTVVLGNVEILRSTLADDGLNHRLIEETQKAVLRAAELTSKMLGFSRRTTLRL